MLIGIKRTGEQLCASPVLFVSAPWRLDLSGSGGAKKEYLESLVSNLDTFPALATHFGAGECWEYQLDFGQINNEKLSAVFTHNADMSFGVT